MRSPGLTEFARKIDAFLFEYLKVKEAELAKIHPASSAVLSPITLLLEGGGKRVRPYLCVLGYEAAGGRRTKAILRAAASLEMFHTFAILHDDVIDASSVRRGSPTTHTAVSAEMGSESRGVAAAILAGDLAFSLSDELLWGSGFPAEDLVAVSARVARMRLEAAAGQMMELDFHPSGGSIPEPLFATAVSLLKTASYSTTGPLVIGATLARAGDEFLRLLEEAGNAIGEAIQLADDLHELEKGGSLLDDLRNGRAPMILLEAAKDEGLRERLLAFWGNPRLTQEQSEVAAALMRGSPAVERVKDRLNDLVQEAATIFQSIPGSAGASLREFAVSLGRTG